MKSAEQRIKAMKEHYEENVVLFNGRGNSDAVFTNRQRVDVCEDVLKILKEAREEMHNRLYHTDNGELDDVDLDEILGKFEKSAKP